MNVTIELNQEEMLKLYPTLSQYQIICECWDKRTYGRVKRAFDKEFSEYSEKKLTEVYTMCYSWMFRYGMPQNFTKRLNDKYELMIKMINFFGAI